MDGKNITIPSTEFANWVIKRRISLGLSQAEFTRKLNGKICAKTISKIEKGVQKRYREDTLVYVAEGLKIEFSELLEIIQSLKKSDIHSFKQKQAALENEDIFSPIVGAPYQVESATITDLFIICGLAKKVYSGIDVIPLEIMKEWFLKNPNGFTVIKNNRGKICGNLDILPLKDNVLRQFIEGKIIERDFSADDIYSPKESDEIEHLYVESFVSVVKIEKEILLLSTNVLCKYLN